MTTLFSGNASSPTVPFRKEDDVRALHRWFAVRRGEPDAAAALEGAGQWLAMARDDTCRVTDVCDFPVRCREGTLWITSPEDPGDTVVGAGEQLSVTSRGTILVAALAPSSIWVPEGFEVEDAQGTSRRRMKLKALSRVGMPQDPQALASDGTRLPTTPMVRLAPFQRFITMLSRILPSSTSADQIPSLSVRGVFRRAVAALSRRSAHGIAAAHERNLSQSVDRADFEHRDRTWDVHNVRPRHLPPVR